MYVPLHPRELFCVFSEKYMTSYLCDTRILIVNSCSSSVKIESAMLWSMILPYPVYSEVVAPSLGYMFSIFFKA